MTKFPDIVLFDLDGTLLDNSEIVIEAYYSGMKQLGYKIERQKIASLAGKNTFDTAKTLGANQDQANFIDKWFWKYFENYCLNLETTPKLLEGVNLLLRYLYEKKVIMGIVTSNLASNARLLLKKAEILHYFDVVIGKEDSNLLKPHPEPIRIALNNLELKGNVWFVGDTASDIKAAKAAGVFSLAIPQEHSRRTVEIVNPDWIFDSLNDLRNLLEEIG